MLGPLSGGPAGFRALARAVDGISDSMLSDRLGELGEAGLVTRTVTEGPTLSVTYALTDAGRARCCRRLNRSPAGPSSTFLTERQPGTVSFPDTGAVAVPLLLVAGVLTGGGVRPGSVPTALALRPAMLMSCPRPRSHGRPRCWDGEEPLEGRRPCGDVPDPGELRHGGGRPAEPR